MAYDGTLKFDTSMDAEGFQNGTEKMSKIASKAFTAIGAAAGAALAVIGKVGVGYNAQMEEYTTNFTTMLGSQEAAIKKVEALKKMAAKTPFGMEDLASGTQTLLAFGIESDRTMDILRQIGDVSLGNKDKFSSLTLAFAQMSSAGRLMGQDLLQMVNAGFNPLQVISEQTGESMADLKKKMEEGAISAEMVAQAFAIATSEGGKFYNGMEAASKTLTGQWSTLKDDAAAAAGAMFQPFNDVLSSQVLPNIIALVGDLTENLSSSQMQGAMTKIAQGFGKIIQAGAELISAVLPPLITVISGVVSAMEALVPVMGVVGAAFLAYKAYTFVANFYEGLTLIKAGYVAILGTEAAATAGATAALWAYNAAQNAKMIALLPLNAAIIIYNALTGASIPLLGGATAAQWGLNAAMLANPVGLIIAGVAALAAGIIALILCLSKGSEAYNKQKEEIKELAKAHKEYEEQLEADQSAAEQAIAKTKGQAEANADLVDSLRTLIDTNDDAGSNNEAIAQTVDQLNTAVEGLGLTYDETTGKLSASIDEVEKYVEAQGQLSVIKAQEDEYNRLLGEQLDLKAKIRVEEERKKVLAKQLEDGIITQREYNDLIKRTDDLLADYGETEQQLATDVQAAHAAIDRSARDSAQAQVNAFEAVNGALDAEGRNLKQLALQYGMTTDQILAEMQEQGLSMADWSAKKATMFTEEGQSLQGLANQWGMTTDEVLAHMDEWGMSLDEFAQHMEDTHTKEGLSLDDLAAKWGTTAEAIKLEMDNMGLSMQEWSDQQQAAWKDYEEAVKARTEGVVNSFKEIPGEYDKSAQEMLEILINNKTRYAEWETAMEEITKQLGPTAAAEFAKLGPEATSAMQEILGSADLLDQYRETFGVKIDEATGLAVENWNDPSFIGAPSTAIDTSAQQVNENTALTTAVTDQMEGARAAAEAVDFSEVGQNIAADIVGGLNSADVSGAMQDITAAISNNTGRVTSAVTSMSTAVQTALRNMKTQAVSIATQMMTEINSAVVSRANTVKASVTSMGNGVITSLNTMRTQAANVALQMMTDINSAIVSRTSTIRASATAAANSVVSGLQPMVSGGENVASNMMDGIGYAMDRKAPSLYAKAREIANRIASIMAEALDVNSPSRVMIRLFENVMMGVYVGMDGMSGMLYREAESIADGITERLTISPDVADALVERMRAVTDRTPLGGSTLVPQLAYAGAGGAVQYTTSLTQNITTPKPLSPSEMTREGQDLLRRSRWQLP